jgi:hypothetical protein
MKSINQSMRIWSLLLLLVTAIACGETGRGSTATPQPALPDSTNQAAPMGDRLMGIDVSPAEDDDYDAAMELAKGAGAEVVSLSVFWDDIESAPGIFDPDPNWLEIANLYYPAQEMKVALVISVLDTNHKRLPADLGEKALNEPDVIARFGKLLEYIFSQIPDLNLVSLSIGNEVDIYLADDVQGWTEYEEFYNAAVEHAHHLRPDLRVGVKATLHGLTGDLQDRLQSLNRASDVIMVTYYPLEEDFTVKEPSVVQEDFQSITTRYPSRVIYFHETGYPSGVKCDSSEEKQAEFVREVFAAWDAHKDQIGLVIFTWLTDVSPGSLREMEVYYGISNPAFIEYLGTLGLRSYAGGGTDKAAFRTLRSEVQHRSK